MDLSRNNTTLSSSALDTSNGNYIHDFLRRVSSDTRSMPNQEEEEEETLADLSVASSLLSTADTTTSNSNSKMMDQFYEFDDHIFHPEFPKCCSKHKREHLLLGYHTSCQVIKTPNAEEKEREGHQQEEEEQTPLSTHPEWTTMTRANTTTTTTTTTTNSTTSVPMMTREGQVSSPPLPLSSSSNDDHNNFSDQLRQHPRHDTNPQQQHTNPNQYKMISPPLLTESTMEALSILKQIEDIMVKLDDVEFHKVYSRIQRKLQRNVLAAGRKSEESRRRVAQLKDQLF